MIIPIVSFLIFVALCVWVWKAQRKTLPIVLLALFVVISCGLFLVGQSISFAVEHRVVQYQAPEINPNIVIWPDEVTATPEVLPTLEAITSPTALSTATPAEALATSTNLPTSTPFSTPTATETPFTGITIKGCPEKSFGKSPIKPAEDMIFALLPYGTNDPEVTCEFEFYSDSQDAMWELTDGQTAIVADWNLGYRRDSLGNFTDECEEKDGIAAPRCEGTWVATGTNFIPKGWYIHAYVRVHEYASQARFASNIHWTDAQTQKLVTLDAFACQYVASTFLTDDGRNIVHNMDSIRVPVWADYGTIYGFDRKLDKPLVCPLP